MKNLLTLLVLGFAPVALFAQLPVINGQSNVCPGAYTHYTVSGTIPGAAGLSWTYSGAGVKINGQSGPVATYVPEPLDVALEFGGNSGELCAEVIDGPYAGQKICKTIGMQPILVHLPLLQLGESQLPYDWAHGAGQVLTQTGSYSITETLTSWLGCDSTIVLPVMVRPDIAHGAAYFDENHNNIFDNNEAPCPGIIKVFRNSLMAFEENVYGIYSIGGLMQGDKLYFYPQDPSLPSTPGLLVFSSNQSDGYDFAVGLGSVDWGLTLNNLNIFRPGFQSFLNMNAIHAGAASATQIGLILPSTLEFQSAIPPVQSVHGDTLFWTIAPTTSPVQQIQLTVKTKNSVPPGTSINLKAFITAVNGEQNLLNNNVTLTRQIFGSFDPNVKEVSRRVISPIELAAASSALEYVIHFQNTGNYAADQVSIIDSLGAFFDLASLRVQSASHDFNWHLDGNVLQFDFPNIQLPDSASNLKGSMGFVQFSLKPLSNLALSTKISNHCDIYFDNNPPVRTEDAVTWVSYSPTGISPQTGNAGYMEVFPNPATVTVHVRWKQLTTTAGKLWLLSSEGVPLGQKDVPEGSNASEIGVADFPDGNYWVFLDAGAQRYIRQVSVSHPVLNGGIRKGH